MQNTGERQISPTIDGIRADHVNRYRFAAELLPKHSTVIDYACGVGYGSNLMAQAGHRVSGYDLDFKSIAYAIKHYSHESCKFACDNANAPKIQDTHDAAVCFETIEHLEDPKPLLKALRWAAPLLIASVPNEEVMPYEFAPGQTYKFHHRHYTKYQFKELLAQCGWCVTHWYGQEGPESDVAKDMNGRTLIAVAQRDELPSEDSQEEKHIAILGLGPSLDQYLEITKRLGGRSRFCDETWAINALGNVFDCDLVFHMDDVRIQEIRAQAAPASNIAAMLGWIKTSKVPVVTSRVHADYPALVEFPLEDILNHLGHDYFNSTAAYAVAFAIHIGATKISLFGMDFSYEKSHDAEKGRGCVEFWLGQAHARGIKINLPQKTSLMDSCYSRAERLYGYDTLDVKFNVDADGILKLDFEPKESLPTAAEIERRYDHSKSTVPEHLQDQHLGNKD
jgi:SAM-dependent methyltransferase